ncbi:MAG: HIT family protein [Gammaproteobacteria bacterium]
MKEKGCIFCELPDDRVVDKNALALAFRDPYPVTEGHTLIIPKRHEAEYFDLTDEEALACKQLLVRQKHAIMAEDVTVTGFNIGMNCGIDAGQTVFHCHIHLIPRRRGDVENPKGGIRHLIPGKGNY